MANPNIVNTTSIYGKTDVLAVSTTSVSITENQPNSGKVCKVNMLVVSNADGSAAVDINADIYRSSAAYYIAKTISVPPNSSIVIVGKDNPIYIMEGDALRVTASAESMAHAVCSYEELS